VTTQRVVVTGAAQGIGRAIAERFANGGAHLHVCDLAADALSEMLAANPGIRGTTADVGEPSSVEKLFAEAFGWMGGVDVLVNNCGIGGPRLPIEDISYAEWDRTIAVNLNGMFYCIKQVVPRMKAQGGGVIINISTESTRVGIPLRAPYVASKLGVEGLTYNCARELGPFNIRCNAILPGAISNPRGKRLVALQAQERGISYQEAEAGFLKYISMGTWIEPSEIAEMAFFLASEAGRHITAQNIAVSGNVEWETS
jgi:NAD(P)-dependent dehydrogenase (short-subunit alcohol dehydrogenase family)